MKPPLLKEFVYGDPHIDVLSKLSGSLSKFFTIKSSG